MAVLLLILQKKLLIIIKRRWAFSIARSLIFVTYLITVKPRTVWFLSLQYWFPIRALLYITGFNCDGEIPAEGLVTLIDFIISSPFFDFDVIL